jgi:PAS domain S-box-containing protein
MQDIGTTLRQIAAPIADDIVALGGWPAGIKKSFVEHVLLRTAGYADKEGPHQELNAPPAELRESEWIQARLSSALAVALHGGLRPDDAAAAVVAMRAVLRALFPREPINGRELHLNRLSEPGPEDVIALVLQSLDQIAEIPWCIASLKGELLHLNSAAHRLLQYGPAELRLGLALADLLAFDSLAEGARRLAAAEKQPQALDATILDRSGRLLNCDLRLRRIESQPFLLVSLRPCAPREDSPFADVLIDRAPIGILLIDRKGHIRRANPKAAHLYGSPDAGALIGHAFASSDGVAAGGLQEDLYESICRQGEALQHTFRFTTVFGKEVYFEATIFPVGHQSAQEGLLLFLEDLHERHLWEESVRQSERLPTLMGIIGGVAHELNNPLTTILGYSELLLSNNTDPVLKTRLASISQEAQRCRTIVENLQSFGLQGHRDKTLSDLNLLVRETLELQEYQLRIDKIDIVFHLDTEIPPLLLQDREFKRVCLSVVANAHRALAEVRTRPRQLTIGTSMAGKSVRLTFQDNGCGMPEEVRHRAFEPFYTTHPRSEALGLGLSVAYGIVQQHRGRIWIESGLGEGTTVNIELPAPIFDT